MKVYYKEIDLTKMSLLQKSVENHAI